MVINVGNPTSLAMLGKMHQTLFQADIFIF
jgi:hypothetical protein